MSSGRVFLLAIFALFNTVAVLPAAAAQPRLAAPVRVAPVEGSRISAYKITFRWSKIKGAKKYQLAIWMDGMSGYKYSKWQSSTAAAVTIKSGRGSIMKWKVRARGSKKNIVSGWSPETYFYLTSSCVSSLTPQQQRVGQAGGYFSLKVSAVAGQNCNWRGSLNSVWVTPVDSLTDRGTRTVKFYAYPNNGSQTRTVTISVDGMNAYVTQDATTTLAGLWSYRVHWNYGITTNPGGMRFGDVSRVELNDYPGTYTVAGSGLLIKMLPYTGCPAGKGDTYTGTITSSVYLSGSVVSCTGAQGTWFATR